MITLIEALRFRCLRDVRQAVRPFQVLVGPNASGKTTFLDVVAFLGQVVRDGPEQALADRSDDFRDLIWQREGSWLELAIEASIPKDRSKLATQAGFDRVRYEVRLEQSDASQPPGIAEERVLLVHVPDEAPQCVLEFPEERPPRDTLLRNKKKKDCQAIVTKVRDRNDNYYSEQSRLAGAGGYFPSIRLGPRKSALANLPDDEAAFPVATWLRQMLVEGVQTLALNSMLLRRASPPGKGKTFRTDGSNLPWVVDSLDRQVRAEWVEHLRTALKDLRDVQTVVRDDDRHRYLRLVYDGGLEVPSWIVSDGTLRMLGLTVLAYVPEFGGVFLIEEPENGIHPRAVETVFQSLSSTYGAQILVASHSPVILSLAEPAQVLCFAKTTAGATCVVQGDHHPALRHWQGDPNLGVLYGAGVLG